MAEKKFGCPRCGNKTIITRATKKDSDGELTRGVLVLRTFDEAGEWAKVDVDIHDWFTLSPRITFPVCSNMHCGARYVEDHWGTNPANVPDLLVTKDVLLSLAESCGTISYKDLSFLYKRITGFWIDHHMSWRNVLGALADLCLIDGEPMLPALVIVEKDGMPGDGFFWKKLGVEPTANQMARFKAWTGYKRKLHRYYFNKRFRPWLAKTVTHF